MIIKKLRKMITIIVCGILLCSVFKAEHRKVLQRNRFYSKYAIYFKAFNRYMRADNPEESIRKLLDEKQIHRVAIYGAWDMGKSICKVMKKCGREVACYIDKRDVQSVDNIPCIKSTEIFDNIDAIIVSSIHDYATIRESLEENYDGVIVPFDILF